MPAFWSGLLPRRPGGFNITQDFTISVINSVSVLIEVWTVELGIHHGECGTLEYIMGHVIQATALMLIGGTKVEVEVGVC
jgi:hypothetical protein